MSGPTAAPSTGGPAWATRRLVYRLRRLVGTDAYLLVSLSAVAIGIGLLSVQLPMWIPEPVLGLVVIAGGFLLTIRHLVALYAVILLVLLLIYIRQPGRADPTQGELLLVLVTGAVVLGMARIRTRLGVQGMRGESMLVELRDRINAHAKPPPLLPGWTAEVVLRPAGGASFSGDFVVASRSADGPVLELVIVDVSGKGVDAGTSALLLSGAFGGLLGAVGRQQFLPSANAYFMRQAWEEGFATAAQLWLDMRSGDFEVLSAGHPPAVHFVARSGRWNVLDAAGPALGVQGDPEFIPSAGRLDHGDALVLYTDGLIEDRSHDLVYGIDRLMGEGDRLVASGWAGGAGKLLDLLTGPGTDDRAVVLIWRA